MRKALPRSSARTAAPERRFSPSASIQTSRNRSLKRSTGIRTGCKPLEHITTTFHKQIPRSAGSFLCSGGSIFGMKKKVTAMPFGAVWRDLSENARVQRRKLPLPRQTNMLLVAITHSLVLIGFDIVCSFYKKVRLSARYFPERQRFTNRCKSLRIISLF